MNRRRQILFSKERRGQRRIPGLLIGLGKIALAGIAVIAAIEIAETIFPCAKPARNVADHREPKIWLYVDLYGRIEQVDLECTPTGYRTVIMDHLRYILKRKGLWHDELNVFHGEKELNEREQLEYQGVAPRSTLMLRAV